MNPLANLLFAMVEAMEIETTLNGPKMVLEAVDAHMAVTWPQTTRTYPTAGAVVMINYFQADNWHLDDS